MRLRLAFLLLGASALLPLAPRGPLRAQSAPAPCPACAEWNAPTAPVRLYGNSWWVGTRGLGAILITGDSGHVLIDAGLPESAPRIMASIRALGFRVEDIRLILNSHAHFDHAGGIAALQRASGAAVAASEPSARELRRGGNEPDDPQYGLAFGYPPVTSPIRELHHGDTLRVGAIVVTAHFTPGHTPGGTSWSWRACEGDACLDFVYADSQTAVSADDFHFTRNTSYPRALDDFARGLAVLEGLSCDVLVTPHPAASRLWERLDAHALRDPEACRRYAARAREQLAERVAKERMAGSGSK